MRRYGGTGEGRAHAMRHYGGTGEPLIQLSELSDEVLD